MDGLWLVDGWFGWWRLAFGGLGFGVLVVLGQDKDMMR